MLENKIHCTFEDARIFDTTSRAELRICMYGRISRGTKGQAAAYCIYVATVWASPGESHLTWHVKLVLHRNTVTGWSVQMSCGNKQHREGKR